MSDEGCPKCGAVRKPLRGQPPRSYVCGTVWVAPPDNDILQTPACRIRELERRVAALEGLRNLSAAERSFVSDAATAARKHDPGSLYDVLDVFADWLEDAAQPPLSARLRRLVPQDGDVLVVEYPPPETTVVDRESWQWYFRALREYLSRRGKTVFICAMPHGSDLRILDDVAMKEMEAAGWIRATDSERVMAAFAKLPLPVPLAGSIMDLLRSLAPPSA